MSVGFALALGAALDADVLGVSLNILSQTAYAVAFDVPVADSWRMMLAPTLAAVALSAVLAVAYVLAGSQYLRYLAHDAHLAQL